MRSTSLLCARYLILLFALCLALCGPLPSSADDPAPTVLYSQDFEGFPEGPAPPAAVKDNTWTGDKTTYRIVQTNGMGGKALEIGVSNFAQADFAGPMTVVAGKSYRISGTVASQGRRDFTILLRKEPAPYTAYISVTDSANETWKRFDFIVAAGDGGNDADVMLMTQGQGALWLGDLRVEEYAGPPPVQEPPLRGNMVQNASFELGWDGWLSRDESPWSATHVRGHGEPDPTVAATGRYSMRLEGDGSLSGPCYPVAYGQKYTLSAAVRADYPDAHVSLMISGPSGAQQSLPVPDGKWGRVEFTATLTTPRGQAAGTPFAGVWVFVSTPPGKHVWVDDVDLHAGGSAPFLSRATREFALTTDRHNNLVVAGQPIVLGGKCIDWAPSSTRPPSVAIERLNETGTVVATVDVPLTLLPGVTRPDVYRGSLRLASLPPGYWRFRTRTGANAACEGEALVACVPKLPAQTPADWQAAVHPGLDYSRTPPLYLSLPACGMRWARLHDVCVATKWPFLEPNKGEWKWPEADAEVDKYIAAGYRVLGLLDGVPAWRLGKDQADWSAMRYPDRDFADWERYVRETVGHFKGRIDTWEVMNEPVFAGKGPGGETNEQWYVAMLDVAYRAARQANPGAFVIGGGGAAGPTAFDSWWQNAMDAGLLSHCDAVSFHGYGRATTQVLGGPQPLVEFMTWMDGEMTRRVGHVMPVWDSEVGLSPQTSSRKFWLPNRGPDDPLEDARQAAVTLLCERIAGVQKTFFYAAFPYRLTEVAQLCMFSDMNDQLTPLAVSVAVTESQIEGLQAAGIDTPAPGTTLLRFATEPAAPGPARTVWAVWTLKGEQRVIVPCKPGAKPTAIGLFGRPVALQKLPTGVSVMAGPAPIFVTEQ